MYSVVHSIDNELEDTSGIRPVVRTALGLCSSVYVSLFGFLLFGDGTLDDVLANFDTDLGIPYSAVLNDAVRVSYAAHLMLVFPIVFYPLRLNIDGLCFPASWPLVNSNTRLLLTLVLEFPKWTYSDTKTERHSKVLTFRHYKALGCSPYELT